jgi:2-phosphoglycerate kinase
LLAGERIRRPSPLRNRLLSVNGSPAAGVQPVTLAAVPVRVYVLGGPSSVGKTTAAATIAERLSAAHLQLNTIAQASQDPRVRRFGPDVDALWRLPAAHVCDLLVQRGEALAAQLNATISRCSSSSSITVVEGEGVHPSLAQDHAVDLVRFAFVLEPDQAALVQTLTRRSARFRALPAAHQHTVAQANRLYGQWLRQQAQQCRQPWVESRPWSTLPDRLVQAWQRPIPGDSGASASA